MNIVICSSEVAPFSKSGGLADVCDKLGLALSRMGHRVMTVAPLYWRYDGAESTGARKEFGVFGQKHTVEYWRKFRETVPASPATGGVAFGVNHVFVQNGCYERHGMYGHNDDLMRFTVLAWACLEAPFCVDCQGSVFGDDVVFLVNDWMVGLVPLIITSHYRRYGCYENARTIFDIHNMGYCGNFGVCNPQDLGLPDSAYFDKLFHDRQIKLLKGGIELSDRVVTVSPSYRDEILTPEGGWGLQDACRGRFPHLDGILNGIDEDEWNPATDMYLSAKFQGYDNFYDAENTAGKASCKAHLQAHMGLNQDPNVPIVCFIGRLAYQKGIDLIESIFPWLMGGDSNGVTGYVQLIMMGSGDEKYASFLRHAEGNNKGKVAGYVGFTPELEHKILAGADILLMPSRYEPCGLPQMYAQKYGTVPIVHATGGLKDSVEQFCPFENKGTGWKFDRADPEGIKYGLWNALNTYKNHPDAWQLLRKRCMNMVRVTPSLTSFLSRQGAHLDSPLPALIFPSSPLVSIFPLPSSGSSHAPQFLLASHGRITPLWPNPLFSPLFSQRTNPCCHSCHSCCSTIPPIAPCVTLGYCRISRGRRAPRGTTRSSSGQRWTPHTSTTRSSKKLNRLHAAAQKVALNFVLESVMGCDVVPHVDVSDVLFSARMSVDDAVTGDSLPKRGSSSLPVREDIGKRRVAM